MISGELQTTPGAELIEVENPATEETLAEVPVAIAATVDRAVASARGAFDDGRWRHNVPAEQEAVLRRLAALIIRHGDELAWREVLDNGKTMAEACGGVGGTAAVFNYYAGWPTKLRGDVHATDRRFLAISVSEPVGVCGQIIPWNYPLLMASWKVAPALAGGNAIVLKPAEQTPLSAAPRRALPRGGAPVRHPQRDHRRRQHRCRSVRASGRGQDRVYRIDRRRAQRMRAAAATIKRITLELGGKNPNVVLADADLAAAVDGALGGAFENSGQACVAGSRVLVESGVEDEFVERLAARADALRVAAGWEPEVDVGPLISREQLANVLGHVEAAREDGARLATREPALGGRGHFMRPTVLTDVDPQMPVFRDEVFGPVVSVTPFNGIEDGIRLNALRPRRGGMDARRRQGDSGRAPDPRRDGVGQRLRRDPPRGAVRRLRRVRTRARAGGAHGLAAYTELKSIFFDSSNASGESARSPATRGA